MDIFNDSLHVMLKGNSKKKKKGNSPGSCKSVLLCALTIWPQSVESKKTLSERNWQIQSQIGN